jgi:hypothetical protein
MTHKIASLLLAGLLFFSFQYGVPGNCHAKGVFKKAVSRAIVKKSTRKAARKTIRKKVGSRAYNKILRRDALRDSKTKAKPLFRRRIVKRYTSRKQASFERKYGIQPRSHMTSRLRRGRPVSAGIAKQRYGLRRKPTVQMKVLVPKGQPVRKNKVIGGKPGYGELTSTKKIPGKNIISIKKIK